MENTLKKGDYIKGITKKQYQELKAIIPGTILTHITGDYIISEYENRKPFLLHLYGGFSEIPERELDFEQFKIFAQNTFNTNP